MLPIYISNNINHSFISEYVPDIYQDNTFFNYDLAIITIDITYTIQLSQRINPICLPDRRSDLLEDDHGNRFIIAGRVSIVEHIVGFMNMTMKSTKNPTKNNKGL